MNKFCLKDVKRTLDFYEGDFVRVIHIPTGISCEEEDENISQNLWNCLQKLEILVNDHYKQETCQAQVNFCKDHPHALWESHCSVCLYQAKSPESIYSNQPRGLTPASLIPVNLHETQELRAKALELSIKSYGNIRDEMTNSIIETSKRFYRYITKGE